MALEIPRLRRISTPFAGPWRQMAALCLVIFLLAISSAFVHGTAGTLPRAPDPRGGPRALATSPPSVASDRRLASANYTVNFTETGLPAGAGWSIEVALTQNTGIGAAVQAPQNVSLSLPNGTNYIFQASANGYTPSPWSGSFNISGRSIGISVAFEKTLYFPLWVNETGLPAGTNWSAAVFGNHGEWSRYFLINYSITDSILFVLPAGFNGTYTASPPMPYLWVSGGVSTPPSGGPVSVQVVLEAASAVYSVGFRESGLPPGTVWYAEFNGVLYGSTNGTISVREPNGTYPVSVLVVSASRPYVRYLPSSGTLSTVLVNGANMTETVNFDTQYYVSIVPSGGGNVAVTNSTGGAVPAIGWLVNDSSLTLTATPYPSTEFVGWSGSVNSAASTITILVSRPVSETALFDFLPPRFVVTFTEIGVPSGVNWSVALNGTSRESSSDTLTFAEPAGTYAFTIASLPGYSSSPRNGSITVQATNVSQQIEYRAVVPTWFGLPQIDEYALLLAVGAAVVAAVVIWRRRRSPGSAKPP